MTDTRHATVVAHLERSKRTVDGVIAECVPQILEAAGIIEACFRAGGTLYLCGNGGSAADAQHMAAEFVSRLRKDRPRKALPAVALTTDTSFLTAFANDIGFAGVFERQVEALGKNGDVLLAISTSGSSENVVRACAAAQMKGMRIIGLTGAAGLSADADCVIAVPGEDTQCAQEAHIMIEHLLCELTEDALFPA